MAQKGVELLSSLRACYMPPPRKASAYAVIVSSPLHSFLRRILNSPTHRDAINAASGASLAVFDLRVREGRFVTSAPPEGCLGMLVTRWIEPKENEELLSALRCTGFSSPLLVAYHFSKKGDIEVRSIELSDENEQLARDRLLTVLTLLKDAIDGIRPEFAENADRSYQIVELELSRRHELDVLVRLWRAVTKIIPFVLK